MARLKRLVLPLVVAIMFISCSTPASHSVNAQAVPTLATAAAQTYLESAFDYAQQYYVLGSTIDWVALKHEIFTSAFRDKARTPADTYPAIRELIINLHNRHSFFLTPQQSITELTGQTTGFGMAVQFSTQLAREVVVQIFAHSPAAQAGLQIGDVIETLNGQPTFDNRFLSDTSDTFQIRHRNGQAPFTVTLHATNIVAENPPDGHKIANQIGYLDVPGVGDEDSAYATMGQHLIQTMDATPTCGWIVDLRLNIGGSPPSMLAAVGPLLGEGKAGAFVSPHGTLTWEYRDGKVIYSYGTNQEVIPLVAHPYQLHHPQPPVAVLTSNTTVSAAEAVTVAFRGLARARSFGDFTNGLPSVNAVKTMPDGALLVITDSNDADRTGHVYPVAPIAPDQYVYSDWAQFQANDDPVIQAATAWLQAQPACRA